MRCARVDLDLTGRGLPMRIHDDHLDRQGCIVLDIESGSEGDDLDIVFDLDVAHELI